MYLWSCIRKRVLYKCISTILLRKSLMSCRNQTQNNPSNIQYRLSRIMHALIYRLFKQVTWDWIFFNSNLKCHRFMHCTLDHALTPLRYIAQKRAKLSVYCLHTHSQIHTNARTRTRARVICLPARPKCPTTLLYSMFFSSHTHMSTHMQAYAHTCTHSLSHTHTHTHSFAYTSELRQSPMAKFSPGTVIR